MAKLTEQQIVFLERYLGFDRSRLAGQPDNSGDEAASAGGHVAIWQAAKDIVDAQLRKLSDRLRQDTSPELVEVAGEVETLLQPLRVRLMRALMDADRAPGDNAARKAALAAVAKAGDWVLSDPRIEAVDQNPWGVPVAAEATLSAALKQLRQGLSSR